MNWQIPARVVQFAARLAAFGGLFLFRSLFRAALEYKYPPPYGWSITPWTSRYFIISPAWFDISFALFLLFWILPLVVNKISPARDFFHHLGDFVLLVCALGIILGCALPYIPFDPGLAQPH